MNTILLHSIYLKTKYPVFHVVFFYLLRLATRIIVRGHSLVTDWRMTSLVRSLQIGECLIRFRSGRKVRENVFFFFIAARSTHVCPTAGRIKGHACMHAYQTHTHTHSHTQYLYRERPQDVRPYPRAERSVKSAQILTTTANAGNNTLLLLL